MIDIWFEIWKIYVDIDLLKSDCILVGQLLRHGNVTFCYVT